MDHNRCIHLDFHTSGSIEHVGRDFVPKEFAEMLKIADADEITLCAKCHHGNFYYTSERFHTHPHLERELLPLQLEACEAAGVSGLVYISAGLDEYNADLHPEWLHRDADGSTYGNEGYLKPGYRLMCFNSGYLDELCAQVTEVVERFRPEGIFLDIIMERPCYCANCLRDMEESGLDFQKEGDVQIQTRRNIANYYRRVNEAARKVKPDIEIFHNSGNLPRSRRDLIDVNTHLEIESLPTGGWGYDHFLASISYLRRRGKHCIGMTGKFHSCWGDIGGFKYPDALWYEAAQTAAFGAGVSVGDQLHPLGRADRYTYEIIGNTFRHVEQLEPFIEGDYPAEVAVLSQDAVDEGRIQNGDAGATRMLLEGHFLFDTIDLEELDGRYKLVILPDTIVCDDALAAKLRSFCDVGGKVLASGRSGLLARALGSGGEWSCACGAELQRQTVPTGFEPGTEESDSRPGGTFCLDLGAEFLGPDKFRPTYFRAEFPLKFAGGETMIACEPSFDVRLTGKRLAEKIPPYFNRASRNFCSHYQTPCDYDAPRLPFVTEGEDGIYIASEIFADYAKNGYLNAKQLVLPLVEKLLGGRMVTSDLPSQAKVSLVRQPGRFIFHALFANTIKRGTNIEIIEDLVPLRDKTVSLRLGRTIRNVKLFPGERRLDFCQSDGRVTFRLEEIRGHQMVILEE